MKSIYFISKGLANTYKRLVGKLPNYIGEIPDMPEELSESQKKAIAAGRMLGNGFIPLSEKIMLNEKKSHEVVICDDCNVYMYKTEMGWACSKCKKFYIPGKE